MEQNLPIVAKKVWSLVRTMLFLIKKNICKRKLLLDLNMMMKRGKIASKALHNLMLHHHRHRHPHNFTFPPPAPDHYEFSCTNTPVYPLSLFTTHKKHHMNHKKASHKMIKSTDNKEHDHSDQLFIDPAAVIKALEMLTSAAGSPAVSGFGRSPVVRQLRVTDSPFPLSNGEEDSYVDEAAERFIMKFYNELRREG